VAESPIRTERLGHILVVTIDRPDVRNAMNAESSHMLSAAFDQADADPEIFLAILAGAGGWFSAGADLKAAAAAGGDSGARTEERGPFGMCRKPPAKPLIAAVEGGAVGGGFEMVLACDLVVAAENARFGLLEISRNLVAMGGGLLRLPRRVPANIAAEIALSGKLYPATFLHQHGLVNRLTPPGGALAGAMSLAEELLANGPTALAATVAILRGAADWTEEEGWALQRKLAEPALNAEDREEGRRAFLEKRAPRWQGK
jgi:enoyl-CoA hydratase